MDDQFPLKIAVTVAEMARMVGLSRARFYQLQKAGVFPQPMMDESRKRPFYDQDAQRTCLQVRRTNCGVNGQVVLFYARRAEIGTTKKKPKAVPKEKNEMIESLKALGLTVTTADVERAMTDLFGARTPDQGDPEIIRAVFLHLKQRKDSADKVG